MRRSLRPEVQRAKEAYTASPSAGLMPCTMPNCDQVTRLRHSTRGTPICMGCAAAAVAVWPYLSQQWWKKPPNFRIAKRKSKPESIVLRDGPLNGQEVRRGSHLGQKKAGSLVTWRTGFIRLVVRHPEEGVLLALPGPQTLPVIGGYVYDSTDDSYWWCA